MTDDDIKEIISINYKTDFIARDKALYAKLKEIQYRINEELALYRYILTKN